ncbi:MAG: hypothetical protein HOO19_12125 [Rhodospirillaceae bacterium]|nr:hypothetical protein [Rhodospirillaceae bacterium]
MDIAPHFLAVAAKANHPHGVWDVKLFGGIVVIFISCFGAPGRAYLFRSDHKLFAARRQFVHAPDKHIPRKWPHHQVIGTGIDGVSQFVALGRADQADQNHKRVLADFLFADATHHVPRCIRLGLHVAQAQIRLVVGDAFFDHVKIAHNPDFAGTEDTKLTFDFLAAVDARLAY